MQRKIGVLVFTHGSRLDAGNESMVRFVERLRPQFGRTPIEPCFMDLGQPDIPAAIRRLIAQDCTHILGYALFLVPGRHLQEDIPAIFESVLRDQPGVTWEISEPMLDDPHLLEVVANRIRRGVVAWLED
ncbi:CbiX/SirB N-terminal domain-containing protein [bacterium]|nr:CbiX/SirB N-terminal domain-containing protein [bacterium]